ncbi:MAG: pilus assembly protein [Endomicrobium sp.]|jgi:hypothetical protein|nr:pilus assembly protein [Endomicrobium sp.]
MKTNKGQNLVEFLLVLTVLFIVGFGVVWIYKKFWVSKYKKIFAVLEINARIKKSKYQENYVK